MNYSQRDKRWAKETLGFGKTTLGSHGCFVTSLAIMCGKTPSEVNSILKKGKFFTGDLIISSNAMAKSLGLTYVGKIDSQPKFKTIAEVDMSPSPGKQQHFVVVKEDGSIIDPWTGTIRPKGTYPIINYRLFSLDKPKDKKEAIKIVSKTPDTSNDTYIPSTPTQTVESGNNQPTNDSMNDFKKRSMSFAWRAGMMAVAVVLDMLVKELSGFGMPAEVTVIAGLILGEISKAIRNRLK